jgi:hypothetical protein
MFTFKNFISPLKKTNFVLTVTIMTM